MRAAICNIMLGETYARHNFIGYHNECHNFNWYFNIGLEALVKVMICLILIPAHIVSSNMKIISFSPAIGFLFTL